MRYPDMPEWAECLTASNYVIRQERRSRYDPSATWHDHDNEQCRCPRCKAEQPLPKHGSRQQCKSCDLWMEVWGNAMYVWTDEPPQAAPLLIEDKRKPAASAATVAGGA